MPAKKDISAVPESEPSALAAKTQYVYILRCADGTFYTGWTTDLTARVATHNAGKGAKYTKSRLPAELIYHEEYDDKREAQARERAIKKLTRAQKEALINDRRKES